MTGGSRLFAEEIGQPIAQGVADGIVENADKIGDAIDKAIDTAQKKAVSAAKELVDSVQDELDGLWDSFKQKDPEEGVRDAVERVSDAYESLSDAETNLAKVRAKEDVTDEEIADAVEAVSDAQESLSDAITAQEDAYLDLLKAKEAAIAGTPAELEAWKAIATQAGLTKDEIEKLIDAYRRLDEAKKTDPLGDNTPLAKETERARRIRTDFDRIVRQGLVGKPEMDAIASYANNPAFQLDEMARRINMVESLFGQPITQYAQGGTVPGSGPQLAVVHGGETITPAGQGMDPVQWGRMAADAFAKRMEQNRRAM